MARRRVSLVPVESVSVDDTPDGVSSAPVQSFAAIPNGSIRFQVTGAGPRRIANGNNAGGREGRCSCYGEDTPLYSLVQELKDEVVALRGRVDELHAGRGKPSDSFDAPVEDSSFRLQQPLKLNIVSPHDRAPFSPKAGERGSFSVPAELEAGTEVAPLNEVDEYVEDDAEPRSVTIFLPDCLFRTVWDLGYMACLGHECWLFLFGMFTLGSGEDNVVLGTMGGFLASRVLATCFWLVDMVVQARTAKLLGWEIQEQPSLLWSDYKRNRLPLDAFITFPFDVIATIALPPPWTYYLMTPRVLRLIRVPELFGMSAPEKEMPRWAECVQFTFWFLILAHVSACIWISVTDSGEQGLDDSTTLDTDPYTVYTQALYFVTTTVTSVGYGDVSPKFNGTRWYNMFLQMVGVALLMLVSGRTGAYFITTDPIKLMQIERRRRLESLMANEKIPWKIQKEAFTIYPCLLDAGKRDYQSILEELPEFIRTKITRHMKVQLMGKVPMFQGLSRRGLTHVANVLCEAYCGSRTYLIKAGDVGHIMYTVAQGMVEVLIPDPHNPGKEMWAANLKAGSWFGEIALLKQTTRTASVRSVTSCVLYTLHKNDFDAVLAQNEELRKRLHEVSEERIRDTSRVKQDPDPTRVGPVVGSHVIDGARPNRFKRAMTTLLSGLVGVGRQSTDLDLASQAAAAGSPTDSTRPQPVTPTEPNACPLDPPQRGSAGREMLVEDVCTS